MANIFIECGTAMASPFNTGIQRVVRSIVRESEAVALVLGHRCVPVAFVGGKFQALETESPPKQGLLAALKKLLVTFAIRVDGLLSRLPFGWVYQKARQVIATVIRLLRRKEAPDKNLEGTPIWARFQSQPVSSNGPDVLLLLDSTWDMRMWAAVDEFRTSGGHVCAVLYDLIPFSHPETVEDHTREAHTSWWTEAPLHLDSVICISKTVRDQFLAWQEEYRPARRVPPDRVTYFYLGSELSAESKEADRFSEFCGSDEPYYLVVGSIEPRKNHQVILDAFEILWREGRAVKLVIVGGHGWKCEAFLDRVYTHPMFNRRLFLVRQATDAELAFLYSNAAALVFASIAEGFGLPIVEAFQRGGRVICSDIPVFREIAGDRANYFDSNDPASLASKIACDSELLAGDISLTSDAERAWLTWKESAEQLFSRLLACAAR